MATAGTYEARHDGAALQLAPFEIDPEAPVLHGTPLRLATTSIAVGTNTLPLGTHANAAADGAIAVTSAAVAEHIVAGYNDVEQSWDFASRPDGAGDLVVTIAVTGESFVSATPSGLHFSSNGLGFSYGKGRWIDAAGTGYDVMPTWHDGVISIRVPRSVVDASVFPATLDPTISAEKALDTPISGSPTGAGSLFADVAFSGAQYLAVWQDNRSGDGGDIYGVRLSSTGAVLDTLSLQIAKSTGIQANPRVVFVNNVYLVVWENQATGDIEAATVVPATAAVTQLGAVAVTPGSADRNPKLGVNGTDALVVYQTGTDDVTAVRFSGGAFGGPITVAATANAEDQPAVASNPGGNYLVAYTNNDGAGSITVRAQQVGLTGSLVGAAFDVGTGPGTPSGPSVAFAGGNYIVAWARDYNGKYTYGTRVTTAGAVLDTHSETVSGAAQTLNGKTLTPERAEFTASLACATTNCIVTWFDARNYATTGYDIYHQVLDTSLAPVGSETVTSGIATNQYYPHVSAAGANYFVAWTDSRDSGGKVKSVYGSRVSSAGAVLDANGIQLVRGNNREMFAATARSSSSWFVNWQDTRVAGDNIVGARLSNALAINDNPAINVSNAVGTQQTPAVAVDPATGNYLNVWSDSRTYATADLYFARVPQSGATLDVSGVAISTAAGDQLRPDIAAGPSGKFMVVWQDGRNRSSSAFDIYGAIIDASGTVLVPDIAIATATDDQVTPRVAYDSTSDRFVVTWADHRTGTDFDVYAARVTSGGTVLDPNGVSIAATSASDFEPDIVFGTDRFLVVWRVNSDIHATRLHANGSAITRDDATDIAVVGLTTKQLQARAAFVNDVSRNFVVVWADGRNRATTGLDIYGNTVTEPAGTLGTEFTVANSTEDELTPAISRPARINGSAMELLVAYQRFSVVDATYRVRLRDLSFAGAIPTLVSIAVTPANTSIPKGTTQQYTATGTYSDGSTQVLTSSATWSSVTTTVATISTAGLATATGTGTTTITATVSGVTGSTHLTVTAPVVVDVSVTPQDPSIARLTTQQFEALAVLSDGTTQDVTATAAWTSSSTAVATITSGGLATGVAAGTSTITATYSGFSDTSLLTVTAATVTSIAVTPANATLPVNTNLQYTATATFSDGTTQDVTSLATWQSNKTQFATISSTGLAHGVAAGSANISATFGGKTGTTSVTVTNATLVSIALSPTTPSVPKTFQLQFTAIGTFSDGTTANITSSVTWTSQAGSVATINGGGRATAKNPGTTTITAAMSGKSAATVLTVTNATLTSIAVSPATLTLTAGQKQSLTATGTFSDGTTLNITSQVSWKSSQKKIASVNAAGVVKATHSGSATITATKNGVTGTASVTVP